ncbi:MULTISPECIES: CS1 type fimbrial major subunit [unclassified Stenotrophomonas]|uniref:CS1 type fimbrial major subunit n=1 Tax=unclassified Stenotrophomonas TaxID=196198 RepID=UPI001311D02D|nr:MULTISPECIES: CS1 type fimbrial major subunit [unclassified Stenotrophomonas]
MSSILNKAALAAALTAASLSANAAESHITVYTNVDPSLALMKHDGTALPDSIPLDHIPGQGLTPHNERVRIYTNDEDKDVEVRLGHAPSLVPKSGTGTDVPLTVRLNKRELTVASQDFLAADLYDGALSGASIIMDLEIAQTTRTPITVQGVYEGIVSVVLTQKP